MEISHPFQGVVCCCMDADKSVNDTIHRLLPDLRPSSVIHHDITCFELKLTNKYYETTIHLFDDAILAQENTEKANSIFDRCQGVILYGDGQKITTEQLDTKVKQFSSVGGEPRILLYHGIVEDCEPYKTLLEWSVKNGYDFIDTSDDESKIQLMDSLSAYKWKYRSGPEERSMTSGNNSIGGDNDNKASPLNDDLMKQLTDFDTLLNKLSTYRDRPELRGNPDDKNIVEIAEILSGLLGEDVDNFLDNEGNGEATSSTETNNHSSS